ncbi:MAG: hypothetical protein ACXWIU_02790 [Limisphaerales bacterium]
MRIASPFASVMNAGFALLLGTAISVPAQTNTAVTNAPAPARTTPAEPVAPTDLSKGASDVVKLFRTGKKDSVLVFYVKYSELDYKLSAEDILYLKHIGISPSVITEMMETDAERKKALSVRNEDDHFTSIAAAPSSTTEAVPPVVLPRAVVQQPAVAVEETEATLSVVYPDYSAFPNYYETFDNSDRGHFGHTTISIGIGVGVGFGGGSYYPGYGHGGHFGGRR